MAEVDDAPKPTRSPAVSQALTILRLLGGSSEPLGVTAISRAANISPSSCFNLLKTLTEEGMTDFDAVSKRYRLGLGAVDIARTALRSDAILPTARAPMQILADRHDAAVALWRTSGTHRTTLIALSESEAATRIHMAVGQRQPLGAGATGRALLSRSPGDADLRSLFDEARWQKPLTFKDYQAQVDAARTDGYALDAEWTNSGITTVASALVDPDGRARYCLSASMFSGRQDKAGLKAIGLDIANAAAQIARHIYG